MESADLATLTVDLESKGYIFRTSGYTVTFPGYMAVYEESADDGRQVRQADDPEEQKDLRIPPLTEGERLACTKLDPGRHFTEPPLRYTEASLIKLLEEKGIGRPSTFATIISTIISRGYVKREGKSLVPTELGEVTNTIMIDNFSTVVDEQFTARMENELDDIEAGDVAMETVLGRFWDSFEKQLTAAEGSIGSINVTVPVETTDMVCDKCGAQMIVKNGRFGKFAACPNYPTCKNTKPLTAGDPTGSSEGGAEADKKAEAVATDMVCEKCGAPMVLRSGRYGSFYACSAYPTCKFTKPKTKDIGVACPKCQAKLVMKTGRNKTVFYSCERYPECDFSSWDMPTDETCPTCGQMLFRKKGKPLLVCHDKACGYSRETEALPETFEAEGQE
jgi:DNA topoisomerase-1